MPVCTPGAIAPDFSLPDGEGRSRSLRVLCSNGPVLLTFFKISCPTCQSSLHFISRLHRNLAAVNAQVWTISQNPPEHTRMFNEEFNIDVPQLFDSEDEGFPVSEAYGLTHVPATFLIRADSRIAQVSVGWDRTEFEEMANAIAGAAGIQAPALFETNEYVDNYRPGCASKN